jgi:DNA-binding transcriptional ArsR family regulator
MPRVHLDPRVPTDWLRAIADPIRLAILRALALGRRKATDLASAVGTESQNIGHHLRTLKDVGLVTASGPRNRVVYALAVGERLKVTATAIEFAHPSGVKVTLRLT